MTQWQPAVQLDFAKAGGLVAGIVQDAGSAEVLMLGFLNEESWLCHLLEPQPQHALEERGNQRQPAAGRLGRN